MDHDKIFSSVEFQQVEEDDHIHDHYLGQNHSIRLKESTVGLSIGRYLAYQLLRRSL